MFQICQYLEDAAQYGHALEAKELARPNIRQELERLESVTRFVVRYRASQTPSLFAAERKDIDSVMRSYSDLNEDAEITVGVKSKMKGGGPLRGVKKVIEKTFGQGAPPDLDVDKFMIYGPDKYSKRKIRPVDLLLSKIRASVDVDVEDQGTELESESAFREIEGSYAEYFREFPSFSVITDVPDDI
jgi:hypothetical protein